MDVPDNFVSSLWESLKMGELVVVERTDSGDQYFGLYQLLTWGESKGFKIIVVDILDSFPLLKAKAKIADINTEIFDRMTVIKVGGTIKTGRVVEIIKDISEPVILVKKFKESYEKILTSDKPILTIVLGLEKLFIASEFSSKNVQAVIRLMSKYVGDERRLAVHLVKTNVIDSSKQPIIHLLEDIATTVIRISKKDKITEFYVVKSVNRRLEGLVIRV